MPVDMPPAIELNQTAASSESFRINYLRLKSRLHTLLNAPLDKVLKESILNNVDDMYSCLPAQGRIDPNNKFQQAAIGSLKSANTLLDVLEPLKGASYELVGSHLGNQTFMHHLFEGAHVLVDDGGALLNHLQEKASLFSRYSSHYQQEKMAAFKFSYAKNHSMSEIDQAALESFNTSKSDFSLRAEGIFNEFLIGKIKKNGKIYTWFQFEGHSHQPRTSYANVFPRFLDGFLKKISFQDYNLEKFQHDLDYFNYLLHDRRENISQYGNSYFTESTPILLKKK